MTAIPWIDAKINEMGQLVLEPRNVPEGAVIRYAYPWESRRVLFLHGQYLAPIEPLPGVEIGYRLFEEKKGISEIQSFCFPSGKEEIPLNTALVACTQNRGFSAYDWGQRHAAVVDKVAEIKPDLLFIGDSITHFFGGEPVEKNSNPLYRVAPDVWERSFAGWRAVNLGFGNDRIENALWRIRHGELDGAAPEAIFVVLIGTNNMRVNSDDEIFQGIAGLCLEILKRAPRGKILLQGVYPRVSQVERVPGINGRLTTLASDNIVFCTPGDVLGGSDGTPLEGMTRDGVHPTRAGYEAVASRIVEELKKL